MKILKISQNVKTFPGHVSTWRLNVPGCKVKPTSKSRGRLRSVVNWLLLVDVLVLSSLSLNPMSSKMSSPFWNTADVTPSYVISRSADSLICLICSCSSQVSSCTGALPNDFTGCLSTTCDVLNFVSWQRRYESFGIEKFQQYYHSTTHLIFCIHYRWNWFNQNYIKM